MNKYLALIYNNIDVDFEAKLHNTFDEARDFIDGKWNELFNELEQEAKEAAKRKHVAYIPKIKKYNHDNDTRLNESDYPYCARHIIISSDNENCDDEIIYYRVLRLSV